MARDAGRLQRDGSPASGRDHQPHSRAASAGTLYRPRCGHQLNSKRGPRCGKDASWKSPKTDFSTALGNPAKGAGFPLSHSDDGYEYMSKPKNQNRTFHLLQKADIFTCYEQGLKCCIHTNFKMWDGRVSDRLR